ncbi:MAG: CBS domain-containing protein [Desulfovibrionaceae bacterium]|nr:CBS domain-containing protein [Desulfovibrionaceae bacterium]
MLIVRDIMTDKLVALAAADTLLAARQLMDMARIRHVPIVDDEGQFVGLVTHRDLLSATVSKLADIDAATQDEIYAGIPVGEIMRVDVKQTTPGASLRDAAQSLLTHKYGCLPVVDGKKLVGILTESDFIRLAIVLMDALDNVEAEPPLE